MPLRSGKKQEGPNDYESDLKNFGLIWISGKGGVWEQSNFTIRKNLITTDILITKLAKPR